MKYFLISNTSRAANYGIGTYISQLKACLNSNEIQLSFIDMWAEVKEYTIEQDSVGNVHYKIPQIAQRYEDSVYCRNAFYFLSQNLHPTDGEQYVFHFNFFQHYPLAARLKSYIPMSHIILSVHYFGWCFELNGNTTRFRDYIQQRENTSIDNPKNDLNGSDKINYEEENISNIRKGIGDIYNHERRFLCIADSVIALSKYARNLIIREYHIESSKVVVIYNGMVDSAANLKTKHLEESQIKNILFVGRLDDIKGIKYLIKAFKRHYESNHFSHLYLVGDGNFSYCLSEIDENWEAVTFTGKVERGKINQLYQKATIGVLPSFHEQCSFTAIEMMMHGIPFIGTDSTGLGEMLKSTPDNIVHINEGCFDENKFVENLANKMNRLLSDHTYYEYSSRAMRKSYCRLYSLDKMAIHYQRLITNIQKPKTILSKNLLMEIDEYMILLINTRPDIDMGFFGMTGIGYYLWRRICDLRKRKTKEDIAHCLLLQEYMIYYMDWLIDDIRTKQDIIIDKIYGLDALISEIYTDKFYIMAVNMIIRMLSIDISDNCKHIDNEIIYGNAIKIYSFDY